MNDPRSNPMEGNELRDAISALVEAKALPPGCHEMFLSYLDTGKLDARLMELCETNENCREALEIVFDAQLQALQEARPQEADSQQKSDLPPLVRGRRARAAERPGRRDWLARISPRRVMIPAACLIALVAVGFFLQRERWNFSRLDVANEAELFPRTTINGELVSFPANYAPSRTTNEPTLTSEATSRFLVTLSGDDVYVRALPQRGVRPAGEAATLAAEQRIGELLRSDGTLMAVIEGGDPGAATAAGRNPLIGDLPVGSAGNAGGTGNAGRAVIVNSGNSGTADDGGEPRFGAATAAPAEDAPSLPPTPPAAPAEAPPQ